MAIPQGLDGSPSGSGQAGVIDQLTGATPTPTVKPPVNPLTGAPLPQYSSPGPVSPNQVDQRAAAEAAAAKNSTSSTTTASSGETDTAAGRRDGAALFDLSNLPLHPRSETTFLYGQDGVKLQRGMLERIQDAVGMKSDNTYLRPESKYRFRFLYNPESVSVSTALDGDQVPPEYSTATGKLTARFMGQETIRFGLMLDRTQEAYEQGIKTRGTQPDIDALYRVINGNEGNPGYLYLSAIRLYWGPTGNGAHPMPTVDGFIQSLSITHTKFTPRMCPIRSIVDITFTRLSDQGGDPA